MESVAILSHSFINSKNSIVPCRTAIVDLGLNEVDPGLAPDGAKCGENKVSINCKHNIDNCAFYVNRMPIILLKCLFSRIVTDVLQSEMYAGWGSET